MFSLKIAAGNTIVFESKTNQLIFILTLRYIYGRINEQMVFHFYFMFLKN